MKALTMMEDGVDACKGDRDLQVMDISEILRSQFGPQKH